LAVPFSQPLLSARLAVLILLAGLSVIVHLMPGVVSAAGGNIQVVETAEEVDFPGNVDLSLTAEGDAEIVEVRLFFRTSGSPFWAYAYPDFDPASRITASLNLTGEVPTYLPPGTELEYYYEITDSLGNVLRTDARMLVYSDTRFDWQETKVGPLTLMYYDQSDSRVQRLAERLEADMERLGQLLQLDSPDEIKGVIYSTRDDTLAAFPQQSRTTTEQHTFQGFAFPEQGLFLGLGLDRGLIIHEAAHLMFGQVMGRDALPTPSWLNEGFASYADPFATVYSGDSLSSRSNPLRSMITLSGTPTSINTFYQKSLSVVAFLIDDLGEANFQTFLDRLSKGDTVDEALTTVYGFDIDGLDVRWAGEAPGQPAPPPAPPGNNQPSPFLFLDAWLLGGLAVLVLVAVSVQKGARRIRPAGAPQEGLQPWEDPDLLDDDYDDGSFWNDDDDSRPFSR